MVKTILNASGAADTATVKREVEVALGELLNQGKITKEDFENAKLYVDEKLITALTAKNNVEFSMISDYNELPTKVQEIMYKSCLTQKDLTELFEQYLDDYTINSAESIKINDESGTKTITVYEFEDLVKSLNERIKNNNAGERLSKGEIKELLTQYGFAINNRHERDCNKLKDDANIINQTEFKMKHLKIRDAFIDLRSDIHNALENHIVYNPRFDDTWESLAKNSGLTERYSMEEALKILHKELDDKVRSNGGQFPEVIEIDLSKL